MYSDDDKAFLCVYKKDIKRNKSEKWVYFLFTRKRVYSFIQFLCHSLTLSLSRSLAFHSFEFDCYYAIIEMKIEALGHTILKGSAKSLLQLNSVNGILWDNSTLPFPSLFLLNSDPMSLKGRCYNNNGELNRNRRRRKTNIINITSIRSFICACPQEMGT